jgi:hypothetical protein
MIWPTLRARSRAMTGGPTRNASRSAVTVAPAARKLIVEKAENDVRLAERREP